ncbi:MAG: ribonuclease [Lachnospiraceae bacterium]|nr:ribonuclease [Lachnospiraceae bacterium]
MQGLEETDGGTEDDEAESSVDSGQEQEDDRGEGSGQEAPDPGSGGSQGEISENGVYTTAEDVALYLHTYGRLPLNFMTKKEARAKGWTRGSLEEYAPGMCIGGDFFGNYEGVLPEGNYHECDINTLGADSRGPERLVYSDDGRIYYTNDHYESFRLLYDGK